MDRRRERPWERDKRRRVKEAEIKFSEDVKRIRHQTRNDPAAQEARLNARRRAQSRKLVKIEQDKGCAIAVGIASAATFIGTAIAAWKGIR